MLGRFRKRTLALGAAVCTLAACEPGIVSKGASFQRSYAVARDALEQGNYKSAIRNYAVMIPDAGPLQSRLRLEYAHALLRAGQFQDAANVSGALSQTLDGSDRAAALAVKGTAEHEMALQAMDNGDYGGETERHLRAAKGALDEMMKIDADLDPHGAMASRRVDIGDELKLVRRRG